MSGPSGRLILAISFLLGASLWLSAGVNKEIQGDYTQRYKNRSMFLKIPIHGIRQAVFVAEQPRLDASSFSQPLAFRVGDQIRITDVNFREDFVRFKISALDLNREAELVFQFSRPLSSEFAEQISFDRALSFSLTEGLSYKEIDSAKEDFIAIQFEQLVRQFISATGVSREVVIQTISAKNPEFARTLQALQQREAELAQLRQQLQNALADRGEAQSQAARLRRELADAQSDADSLKAELANVTDDKQELEERIQRLRAQGDRWQSQEKELQDRLDRLFQGLEVEKPVGADLEGHLETLGTAIEELKQQEKDLTQRLEEKADELAELQKSHDSQSANLRTVRSERNRLSARLRDLTSDKDSINARFLKVQDEKEALETAQTLSRALQVQQTSRDNGVMQADVYLLSQKIGTLEIEIPQRTEEIYQVRFEVLSPDTVKFSEEERELYAALGEKLRIETTWHSSAADLKARLLNEPALQSIGPREERGWQWTFTGDPTEPESISLRIELYDTNEQKILLAHRDFVLMPSGPGGLLYASFSIWYLLLSFTLGASLAGAVMLRMSRRPTAPAAFQKPRYVSEKKL